MMAQSILSHGVIRPQNSEKDGIRQKEKTKKGEKAHKDTQGTG
jgi:hypothetical protein